MKSDLSRFGALSGRFRAGNPQVVNAYVDRIKTLLEAIESRILYGQPAPKPSALRGSSPRPNTTPATTPKADHPKTPAPAAGTKQTYPPMRPKLDKVTVLAKADKVCCAFFRSHTQSKGCVPLSHIGILISEDP